MNSVFLRRIDFQSREYLSFLELRRKVLREPLGMDFFPEELLSDKDDIHFVAQIEDQIIGGLIVSLVPGASPSQARIRQVAVAQEFQGQGVGEKLMAKAESFCQSLKIQKVFLHARYGVRGFYAKLGYIQEGEIFEAVSIPHIAMLKEFREK